MYISQVHDNSKKKTLQIAFKEGRKITLHFKDKKVRVATLDLLLKYAFPESYYLFFAFVHYAVAQIQNIHTNIVNINNGIIIFHYTFEFYKFY